MVYSPFPSITTHAPRPEPGPDRPSAGDRPRGARRSHIAATVSEVRHLVETTLLTYAEIAQRTGVARRTIWHWSNARKWMRPGFAPRWTHTVPAWRAGRQRRRRMLAVRLVALAERYLHALEVASAIDAAGLREARALLSMAKLATGPNTPRSRLLAAVRPVAEGKPRARARSRSQSMIPKSMSSTPIGDGYRFSEKDHAQTKNPTASTPPPGPASRWHETPGAFIAQRSTLRWTE